eukprot:TRINITY_DN3473_c0_g1_i2.p1 TRINITY_DN3473_c0_g1~~TRINITY_DN3473_c0_g1_i2.p1  ORF type:complete len:291 (+),score=65.94 TRINITY_DN3473_c0_g1_i2:87-959(+)
MWRQIVEEVWTDKTFEELVLAGDIDTEGTMFSALARHRPSAPIPKYEYILPDLEKIRNSKRSKQPRGSNTSPKEEEHKETLTKDTILHEPISKEKIVDRVVTRNEKKDQNVNREEEQTKKEVSEDDDNVRGGNDDSGDEEDNEDNEDGEDNEDDEDYEDENVEELGFIQSGTIHYIHQEGPFQVDHEINYLMGPQPGALDLDNIIPPLNKEMAKNSLSFTYEGKTHMVYPWKFNVSKNLKENLFLSGSESVERDSSVLLNYYEEEDFVDFDNYTIIPEEEKNYVDISEFR